MRLSDNPSAWVVVVITSALTLFATWGCEPVRPELAQGFEVRDSMGLRIVDNYAPELTPGSWHLEARTVICSSHGEDGEPRLHQIADIVPVGNDVVAVPVYSSQEVLVCSEGAVRSIFGGQGDGPSEFRGIIGAVWLGGDSLAVVQSRRTTIVDYRTGRGRRFQIDEADGAVPRFQRSTRAIAAIGSPWEDATPEGGWLTDLFLWSADSAELKTIRSVPWDTSLGRHIVLLVLWEASVPWVLGPRGYWLASRDTAEVRFFDSSGLQFSTRFPYERVRVTAELWGRGAESFAESVEFDPPIPAEALGRMVEPPDTLERMYAPAVVRILLDPDGRPWMRLSGEDPGISPQNWRVISTSGRWLTDVQIPPDVSVVRVNGDRIYGIARNEIGLESAVSFSLIRDAN